MNQVQTGSAQILKPGSDQTFKPESGLNFILKIGSDQPASLPKTVHLDDIARALHTFFYID